MSHFSKPQPLRDHFTLSGKKVRSARKCIQEMYLHLWTISKCAVYTAVSENYVSSLYIYQRSIYERTFQYN